MEEEDDGNVNEISAASGGGGRLKSACKGDAHHNNKTEKIVDGNDGDSATTGRANTMRTATMWTATPPEARQAKTATATTTRPRRSSTATTAMTQQQGENRKRPARALRKGGAATGAGRATATLRALCRRISRSSAGGKVKKKEKLGDSTTRGNVGVISRGQ